MTTYRCCVPRGAWVAFILLALALPALAARQVVLVDRSGSMRPYYQSGTARSLVRMLVDGASESGKPDLVMFSTSTLPVSGVDAPGFDYEKDAGSFTKIDIAVEYAFRSKYDIAWLLTDNIQHYPGSQEGAFLDRFYDYLRGDSCRGVVVFPVPQPPGLQGLTVYALLLGQGETSTFDRAVADLENRTKGGPYSTSGLKIKPLDQNTIAIEYPQGQPKPKQYSLGQNIKDSIPIVFRSLFKHIGLTNAAVTCEPPPPGQLASGKVLKIEKASYSVVPTRVDTLRPGERTGQVYMCSYDLGRLALKGGVGPFLKAATGASHESLGATLPVRLELSRQNLNLSRDFLDRYNANSADEARRTGRIYGVSQLPVQMSMPVVKCSTAVSVPVDGTCGPWPAVILIVILAVLVAIVVLLARYLAPLLRRRGWKGVPIFSVQNGVQKQCRIVGDTGQVLLGDEALGTVDARGVFRPGDEYQVDGGRAEVKIEKGSRFDLFHRQGAVTTLIGGKPDARGETVKKDEDQTLTWTKGSDDEPEIR
ncbi:MAG: hypothetical protein NTX53_20080 [candidate division WOR-3 bacterium]|nr:hypothetical protein [candidate division WOR-3 bacterium]